MSASRCIKPPALRRGDTVAVLTPSWGGPAVFPHVMEAGLQTLRDELGLAIREYPTTRAKPDALRADPRARARDLMAAFRDPAIRAIFTTIGGDDSIRLLPFLEADAVREQPKILMGYSDVTTLLLFVRRAGVVSFHGPAVMAGFAQASALPPQFLEHVRSMLFEGTAVQYRPYPWFAHGYPHWGEGEHNARAVHPSQPATGPRFLQGSGTVRGELLGGCVEVLAFMAGTPFFPAADEFDGRFLVLETSEEKPPPEQVRRTLVSFGLAGIVDRLAGILVGRSRDYTREEQDRLDGTLIDLAREHGRGDLVLVTELDFGHTDPQHILPFGVEVEVDCGAKTIATTEPAVYRA